MILLLSSCINHVANVNHGEEKKEGRSHCVTDGAQRAFAGLANFYFKERREENLFTR